MRYIGNKTKLLPFIRSRLKRLSIRSGTVVDPFAGTASVARALKADGFRVLASDIMEYGHVLAHTYVQTAALPAFAELERGLPPARTAAAAVLMHLNQLPGTVGFISEHYTPAGAIGLETGRMYYTPVNAVRIDAIRVRIEEWRQADLLSDDAFYFLLTALIEASDRVANTTGVYAACVKSWQPNALRTLQLRMPRIVPGEGSCARRADANALVADLEPFDVLYLDPPYNNRQYAAYYHLPELIAVGWFGGDTAMYGKSGLLEYAEKRSEWSMGRTAGKALERLVASARCRHVVMSYNSEGIIAHETIERIFREHGRAETYQCFTTPHKRYRSDADSAKRRYLGDRVVERLYCVEK